MTRIKLPVEQSSQERWKYLLPNLFDHDLLSWHLVVAVLYFRHRWSDPPSSRKLPTPVLLSPGISKVSLFSCPLRQIRWNWWNRRRWTSYRGSRSTMSEKEKSNFYTIRVHIFDKPRCLYHKFSRFQITDELLSALTIPLQRVYPCVYFNDTVPANIVQKMLPSKSDSSSVLCGTRHYTVPTIWNFT